MYSPSEEVLNEKFRYARDMGFGGSSTILSSRSGSGNNSMKLSVMSASNTSNGFVEQSEIVDFMSETFKAFLVDVDIFRLKGFKVTYKISTIHTS